MNKAKRFSKRHLETITIFEYYIKHLLPSLRPELTANTHQPLQLKTHYRNITYNYISDVTRGFERIDYKKVYDILRKLYLTDLQQKTAENEGVKLQSLSIKYTPFSAVIQDHIQILISNSSNMRESTRDYQSNCCKVFRKSSTSNPFSFEKQSEKGSGFFAQNQHENLAFYIIHSHKNKEEDCASWLNFVQKYEFTSIKYQEDRPPQPVIVYQATFSYNNDKSAFSLDFGSRFLQKYFQESCLFVANRSIFLKHLTDQIRKSLREKIESVARSISNASFDHRHRRYLKLKSNWLPIFQQLKSRSTAYIRQMNPSRKQNPYLIENTICRLMENNDFKMQESWKALKYYFEQQKRLRDKYNWQSFRQFHNMNIFNLIGKDNMGRPVLLCRIRNILMSTISDRQLFFDYHFYLFEVYLQDQMEGWVDEFDVIVDGRDQIPDNNDLSFSKQVLTQIFKLSLGRTYHLIGFNIGILGKVLTTIFFPLLPERILKHVEVFKANETDKAISKLRQIMPSQTIPDFLGGQNHRTYFEEQNKPRSQTTCYEATSSHSLITYSKGR